MIGGFRIPYLVKPQEMVLSLVLELHLVPVRGYAVRPKGELETPARSGYAFPRRLSSEERSDEEVNAETGKPSHQDFSGNMAEIPPDGHVLALHQRAPRGGADFILMKKSGHGRGVRTHTARTVIRFLLPYRGNGVKTMTADNSSGFSVHGRITEAMKGTAVCFANPTVPWQKGAARELRQTHKAICAGKHGLQ